MFLVFQYIILKSKISFFSRLNFITCFCTLLINLNLCEVQIVATMICRLSQECWSDLLWTHFGGVTKGEALSGQPVVTYIKQEMMLTLFRILKFSTGTCYATFTPYIWHAKWAKHKLYTHMRTQTHSLHALWSRFPQLTQKVYKI